MYTVQPQVKQVLHLKMRPFEHLVCIHQSTEQTIIRDVRIQNLYVNVFIFMQ